MTSCLLLRHADTPHTGRVLTGRAPGVLLTTAGREQARRAGERLRSRAPAAIYTSPRERAAATAAIAADILGIDVQVDTGLDEIDFGDWTGAAVADLAPAPDWRAFNTHRATSPVPNAGFFLEAQARVVRCLVSLARRHEGATFLAVTHADLIRAALAAVTGTSLDLIGRVDIDPASLTELVLGRGVAGVRCVNDTGHLAAGHVSCTPDRTV